MAKMVGLNLVIKLGWMKKAAAVSTINRPPVRSGQPKIVFNAFFFVVSIALPRSDVRMTPIIGAL